MIINYYVCRLHGLFHLEFAKKRRLDLHLQNAVHSLLPDLQKHFNKEDIKYDLSVPGNKWFITNFVQAGLPYHLLLRYWDLYMAEGERIVVPFALTLLRVCRKRLLRSGIEDFGTIFQRMNLRVILLFFYVFYFRFTLQEDLL